MTFHPKLCNVIKHDHPEFLYFSLYRGYVFWVFFFFFLRKHFKSHRLTLCSFFSVISEVSLNYILNSSRENWIVFVYKTCVHLKCEKYWGRGAGYLVYDIIRGNNAWTYFRNSWTMYLTCKICTVLMSAHFLKVSL